MATPPRHGQTTTTVLLDSLKDAANAPVWQEFDARYRPILHGFARKLGLQEEDAADVAQQALRNADTRNRITSWCECVEHGSWDRA